MEKDTGNSGKDEAKKPTREELDAMFPKVEHDDDGADEEATFVRRKPAP